MFRVRGVPEDGSQPGPAGGTAEAPVQAGSEQWLRLPGP